jgi:hypothetical protein
MIMAPSFSTRVSISLLALTSAIVPQTSALSTPYGKTTKNVATQVLQGTGEPVVDLNMYNLELSRIEQEWTANLVLKAGEKEGKLQLGTKDGRELFVDTVSVIFPRQQEAGLGIQLLELAGGREDDVGITLVTGVAKGTPADGQDILPGDSIAQVSIVRNQRTLGGDAAAVVDTLEEFVAKTECMSYDATVEAIQGLPPPSPNHDEYISLKLKRLRRKPKVTVKLQYPPSQNEPDATITFFAGENLRQGMLVRGVKLNDPLALRFDTKNGGNCGAGGLCRTCSVSVMSGGELLNPQRIAEEQMLRDVPRWRLACKAIVGFGMKEGELTLRVNPRQWD